MRIPVGMNSMHYVQHLQVTTEYIRKSHVVKIFAMYKLIHKLCLSFKNYEKIFWQLISFQYL